MSHRPSRHFARTSARKRLVACMLAAMFLAGGALPAVADEYDSKRSGHPLRIVAYVLHPIGVLIDFVLLRPAHWIGSQEPMRTIFGHEEDY